MKIAMPIWNARISPVFDVAQRLIVLTIEADRIIAREKKELGQTPKEKVQALIRENVSVLICGAISGPLALQVNQAGVELIHDICGAVDEVAESYLCGSFLSSRFIMPGCCRRRRRFQGCRGQMMDKFI